jgi:CheY-like chemotaxis protein
MTKKRAQSVTRPRATLLLIEPDRDNRQVAASFFEHEGFAVLLAESLEEGIDLARRERPDLIITELFERTHDGWMILESLRKYPETSATPIIAFSAYAFPPDEEAAIKSGVNLFVAKPRPLPDLQASIDALLQS